MLVVINLNFLKYSQSVMCNDYGTTNFPTSRLFHQYYSAHQNLFRINYLSFRSSDNKFNQICQETEDYFALIVNRQTFSKNWRRPMLSSLNERV